MKKIRGGVFLRKFLLLSIATLTISHLVGAQEYQLESPDKQLSVSINIADSISFSIDYKDISTVDINGISLELDGGDVLGVSSKVKSKTEVRVKELIEAPLSTKSSIITDEYNALTLTFEGHYALEFRVYNHGCAYRYITSKKK